MKHLAITWNVIGGLINIAVVIGILSVAESKFETIVLAGLIELYVTVLFNFSLLGENADTNNYAAFVRFRILSAAHGVTGNEDGEFVDQEKALIDAFKSDRPKVLIMRISNAIVSLYALFKIVQAII